MASRNRHLKEIHKIGLDEEEKNLKFKCKKKGCETMCAREYDLRTHVQNVHSNQEVDCEFCGRSFKCAKSVKEHQRRTCPKAKEARMKEAQRKEARSKHEEKEKREENDEELEEDESNAQAGADGDDESSDSD